MRLLPRYVIPKNWDVGRSSTNMIHLEFCRNWQRCGRWGRDGGGEWVHKHGVPLTPMQTGAGVALCYLASLSLVSHLHCAVKLIVWRWHDTGENV